jgi:hypothetical protein
MADRPKPSEKALRDERLQAALRENLKRRKRQARGRTEPREGVDGSHDSAGIVAEKHD